MVKIQVAKAEAARSGLMKVKEVELPTWRFHQWKICKKKLPSQILPYLGPYLRGTSKIHVDYVDLVDFKMITLPETKLTANIAPENG